MRKGVYMYKWCLIENIYSMIWVFRNVVKIWDHMQEIQDDGNVYDMNNIIIRTPYNHIQKGKDRK